MDKGKYKILIIEDNPGDSVLVEGFLLEQIESPEIAHAGNFKKAKETLLLKKNKFDIVLLDLSLPDKKGEPLIHEVVDMCSHIPVIVLTGYADFAFGVKSLSLGISDYILKEDLTSVLLYKSIVYSSERKKGIVALEESEKRYNDLFHLSPLPMWVIDLHSFRYLDVNEAAIKSYGYSREEFLSMTIMDLQAPEDIYILQEAIVKHKALQQWALLGTYRHKKKNGIVIHVEIQSNDVQFKGKRARITLANDVTERLKHITAIEEQNTKLKEIAWMQSHVVRAPLARIMGLIHLYKLEENEVEKIEMLNQITVSANELDTVIRNISDKADAVKF